MAYAFDLNHTPRADSWRRPPHIRTDEGALRRVGIEIELGGLELDDLASMVKTLYGGWIERTSRFATNVRKTTLGDFRVELDSAPLKRQRYRELIEGAGLGEKVADAVEGVLEAVARGWIPNEIVAPPVPLEDLQRLEPLRRALLEANAKGTRASILYTFGFQLNPEVPSKDPRSVVRYLRAFLALYDWLRFTIDVDPTRKLLAFAEPFPESYRRLVLDSRYEPSMVQLIDDYLQHNPTRNRALDMLPFFCSIDSERVLARAEEPDQVNPRPTFHYRLPNSLIDDPSWSFVREWNRWVEIEYLAEDEVRLRRISEEVLASEGEKLERDHVLARARGWGLVAT